MPGNAFDHLGDIEKDFGDMFGEGGGAPSYRFPTSHVAPPSAFRRGQTAPAAAPPVAPVPQPPARRPARPARPDDGSPATAYPDLDLNERPPASQPGRPRGRSLADDLIAEIDLKPSYPPDLSRESNPPVSLPPVRVAEGELRPVSAPVRAAPRRQVRALSVLPAAAGPVSVEGEGERAVLYRTLAATYARLAELEIPAEAAPAVEAVEPRQALVPAPSEPVATPAASGDDVPVEHEELPKDG